MFTLTHPSHAQDMGKFVATKAEIVEYLGSEELFNQFLQQEIIYADNTTKDKSTDSESKPKLVKSDRGDK